MMISLRRILCLPTTEKILLVKALWLVATIRLALWLLPTRMLRTLIEWNSSPVNPDADINWKEITAIVRSVRIVSRFIPHATCLTQALAASILLRGSGQSTEFKIGVTKGDRSQLVAHAWLEKDGRIILGEVPDQGRFVALRALPL